MRKGRLKSIAWSIIDQFNSRENDFRGYWAVGQLYKQALKEEHLSVAINLLRGDIDFSENGFDRIAQMLRTRLRRQLRVHGHTMHALKAAIITISFNDTTDAQKWRSGCGDPYVCDVNIEDISGKSVTLRRTGYCRPHDPKLESKRWDRDEISIGLGGDGDEIDILEDIEKSFKVRFEPSEAESACTVGDVYELLLEKIHLPIGDGVSHFCATHRAFNMVKQAISRHETVVIRPDTRFETLAQSTHDQMTRSLRKMYGLNLPSPAMSGIGCSVYLAALAAPAMLLAIYGISIWLMVLFVVCLVMLPRFLPRRHSGTVGELARNIVDYNYFYFVDQGAKIDADTIWQALEAICIDYRGASEKRITPMTFFMA